MTELTITPKISDKTAKFKGVVAAGEHVAVTIKGGAPWLCEDAGANLTLRVIDRATKRVVAIFPRPGEPTDIWEASESGNDLNCTLNLNTDRMMAAARRNGVASVVFTLGDVDDPRTLYFLDNYHVIYWPEAIGDEPPYDMDKLPTPTDEWTELVISLAGSLSDHVGDSTRHVTMSEKEKLEGIEEGANKYVLPAATKEAIGGVKQGTNINIAADGTISAIAGGEIVDVVPPSSSAMTGQAADARSTASLLDEKRGLTDLSVDQGKWLLVEPDGTLAWLVKPDPQQDTWTGDGFTLTYAEVEAGWGLIKMEGGDWVVDEFVALPPDTNRLEFPGSYGTSVYRLVRGSRLALDTEVGSVSWDNVTGKPTFATVATSGLYNDLKGKPALAAVATSGSYADLTNKPIIPSPPLPGSADPLMDGTASPGSVSAYSRTDHVHPTDTSRQAALSNQQLENIAAVPSKYEKPSGGIPVSDLAQAVQTALSEISGKADAADLRYRIAEAEYSQGIGPYGAYVVSDRAVNLITATDETSIDIELPDAVTVDGVRYCRDFLLDIDNSANASDLALEFTNLGSGDMTGYAFVIDEDDDIAEMMTVESGKRARLYFTETPYGNTSGAAIHVARVTLGADIDEIPTTTQGGN